MITPLIRTGFTTPREESKHSKGVMIKSIALHELRKNKGKMPIEIKTGRKVGSLFFNFGTGQHKARILSVKMAT